MVRGSVHRLQSNSGKSSPRDDGKNRELAPPAARPVRRWPRGQCACGACRRGGAARVTTALQSSLAERVEALAAMPSGAALPPDAEGVVEQLLGALERGEVRSAE